MTHDVRRISAGLLAPDEAQLPWAIATALELRMDKRVPGWMVALLACVRTALATFMVMFFVFYAQRVVARKRRACCPSEIVSLREVENDYRQRRKRHP